MEVSTTLRNLGGRPLHILEIRTSCGCTSAQLEREVIEPGGPASLLARIRLGDAPAARSALLKILSDDPRQPVATLTFDWQIVPPLRTEPAVLDGLALKPGDEVSEN